MANAWDLYKAKTYSNPTHTQVSGGAEAWEATKKNATRPVEKTKKPITTLPTLKTSGGTSSTGSLDALWALPQKAKDIVKNTDRQALLDRRNILESRRESLRSANVGGVGTFSHANDSNATRIRELDDEIASVDRFLDLQNQIELQPYKQKVTPAREALSKHSIQTNLARRSRGFTYEDAKRADEKASELRREVEKKQRGVEGIQYKQNYQDITQDSSFTGQFSANYDIGQMGEDEALAWNTYLNDPTEENRIYAESVSAAREAYMSRNQEALEADTGNSWISKDLAGYLPQFLGQNIAGIKGGLGGAAAGTVLPVAGTAAGAKAGYAAGRALYGYETARGRVFKALLDAGIPEEQARQAANDEAVISSVIEGGDAVIDMLTLGFGKLFRKGGAAAVKNGLPKLLRNYGINVGGEGLQEWTQEGVSIANQKRNDTGLLNLAQESLGQMGRAITGEDLEAREQMNQAGLAGLKIAAMMGGGGIAFNTALSKATSPLMLPTADQAQEGGYSKITEQDAINQFNQNVNNRTAFVPDNPLVNTLPTVSDALYYAPGSPAYRGAQSAMARESDVFFTFPTVERTGGGGPYGLPVGSGTKSTASTGEAEIGLIPMTEQAAASLSTGKNNVIARTISDIVYFAKNARAKKGGGERLYMGTVPDATAQFIRNKTGMDVTGYTAVLPGSSVQHIFKNHGNDATEAPRGQRAVTENDIVLIPRVLADPDSVTLSTDTDAFGRPVMLISKQIGDNYITAQAITDGRHMLSTNSLWIQKKKNPLDTVSDADIYADPAHNVQNVPPSGSSASIIAQDTVESNHAKGADKTGYSMSEAEWTSLMAQEPESFVLLPTAEQQYGPKSSVGAARKGFDPYSAFLGTKSEFFPEGANAARPVDVPTTDAEGNPIRKTASTAMGAKAIPDEVVGDIQSMIMSGDLSYKRVTDRDSINRAVSRIKADGFQRSLGDFSDAVQKGVVSKDLATLGQQLLVNAANAGDVNSTAELLSLYAQMETVAGQAVQAASILRKLSPTAQLHAAQKAVDNLNKTIKGKKKKRPSAENNVPVEIWMQRVGENLADELSRRVNAPKDKAKSVSETILSDLRKFANESAPKRLQTGKKRSNIDRIVDLFQNKEAYNEAWQAAKDTLSDNFENNPSALAAFDKWLDSSLDYSTMLTKELTGQTDIAIPQSLVEKFLQQTDQAGRDTVMEEIYKSIGKQVPSDWKDKWNAWRYLSMLGNPRTHIRNIVGNVGFQPVRFTKDRIAAVIESGVSAASGGKLQRTKSFATNPALYAAAWQDFDSVSDVLSGNKYDDVQSIINDNRTIFKTKPLEALRKANTNALSVEDMWFKRITYAGALSGYLNANGVTADQLKSGNVDPNLLSAARDYAGQEALKATYNDRNVVSDKVIQAARALGPFGEAVLPFKRTPANILVRGFEYSPLGLAKGLTYDLYQVKQGNMTGAQAIDNIAAGMTGTGLMLLGGLLAAAGIVSGGAGDDEKQAQFNELTGGQTYALNLPGGGSITLDWLAPEALPFFMGVQAMESFGEEGLTGDTITSAFASISEPMLEMSMLQSLNDLIDNVSYAASNEKLSGLVGSSLISYLTQAIPTIGGQIERTFEDKRYSTYTNKDSLLPTGVQYALGKASAKIPVWDFQQVPYIDAWGREEETGLLPMRALNNFLNPAYTSSLNVTPVDEEIQRLYNATGVGSVIPSRADKSITVDGEDINLSGDKYVEYAKTKGGTAFDLLSSIIDTSAYKGLSDNEKVKLISDVYEYANSVGKAAVSSYKPEGFSAKVQSTGVDPADYILYRSTADADNNGTVTQSEAAFALLPMKNLSNAEKGKVWQSQNSSWNEKKNPFSGALASAGIDASTATSILNKYSEVYNMDIEPGEQAAELSKFLDSLNLTVDQRTVVDDTYKFYNMFPATIKAYNIETMGKSAKEKWPRVQAWGMSEEDYLKYYPMVSSGKNADCLQKLQNAGMTQAQANYFWDLVKSK